MSLYTWKPRTIASTSKELDIFLLSFDRANEIVLRADPLPTRAAQQSTKILLRISFFSTIHEIITPRKNCAFLIEENN